uniref:Ycf58 n=1 Tax=Gracilaria firma TaxID=2510791 RepID=A0A2Z2JII1_9FLOR|nr:Ycf58 [Gracilaria changii]ART65206.1 Ycf58 [Gracilaria changii]
MIYKNILNKLEGKWICQKTVYFIRNNQVIYNKQKIEIKQVYNIHTLKKTKSMIYNYQLYNIKDNNKTYYLFLKEDKSEFGELRKITNDEIKYYRFKTYKNNCIKIESIKKNIIYHEYIYLINPNFKVTICLLKKNKNYLATSFVSAIRVSNQL